MAANTTVDEVIRLADGLSALEKLKVIERLAPELEAALAQAVGSSSGENTLDEQYQRGYENTPEDVADLEALLPHLPLPTERWE